MLETAIGGSGVSAEMVLEVAASRLTVEQALAVDAGWCNWRYNIVNTNAALFPWTFSNQEWHYTSTILSSQVAVGTQVLFEQAAS